VALNDPDIQLDLVKANHVLLATNITGLAGVATAGTLVSLSDLDAGDRAFTNYLASQDSVTGSHTFVQSDSGCEKVFTGSTAATWTIPVLAAGTHAVVHNIGSAAITFSADGVTLKGADDRQSTMRCHPQVLAHASSGRQRGERPGPLETLDSRGNSMYSLAAHDVRGSPL
jgi:hypothetical protein